jgi:hypothetical protein
LSFDTIPLFGRIVGRHVPAVDGEELKQLAIEPQKLQRRSLLGLAKAATAGSACFKSASTNWAR